MPEELLPLMDAVGLFNNQSGDWLKLLGRHIAAFRKLGPEDTAKLLPGEMWFWAKQWVQLLVQEGDEEGELTPSSLVRVMTRPRVSQHGGASLLAVKDGEKVAASLINEEGQPTLGVEETIGLLDEMLGMYAVEPPDREAIAAAGPLDMGNPLMRFVMEFDPAEW